MSLVARYADAQSMNRLSHALGLMTASELAIERSRFLPSKSLRKYIRLICGKTAGLFSLSLYLGAKEAGLPDSDLQTFRRLGYNLGLCFQIQDDILDYVSAEGTLGKTAGQDLKTGYFTLPVILCLTDGKSRLTNGFRTLKIKPWKRAASFSLSAGLKKEGWIERSWETLELFKRRVFSELKKLPNTETSVYLEEFSRKMFARSY
jgi:heptaprenyl diphosphate synthase